MSEQSNQTAETLTVKQVTADGFDYKSAAATIRERVGQIGRQSGMVMYDAAVLMLGAQQTGKIGKSEDAVWRTGGAFVTSLGYTSTSQITLMSRLAKAVSLGIRAGSDHWTFLTFHGDKGRVGEVVKAAETGKQLRDGLAPLMREVKQTGKVAPKNAPTPTATADEKAAEKVAEVAAPKPTVKDVLAAWHALRPVIHEMSDEKWASVKDALLKDIKSEDTRRDLLGKKATEEVAA